ncbi:zinc-binding dehydrogenase [Streptomyces platensis]|uniref:zinc-binding dehydrogenase n=1 Tax=Streptomyces platensis TaxID=58346 RepID=UPI002E7FDF76|nr:zinc-binding dehydrogenase [Streptomyces platensis]WTI56314.1 zinc-binding dehydrogenase [Streptomyces platensis]WUB78199.1 zinc-binding dehydrogenase [Streptomyces platensis]
MDEAADRLDTHGTGIDVIVETSGRAVEPALERLARGGQLLAIGLGGGPISVNPAIFADHSKRLVGSIDSLNGSFAESLDLIVSGRVPAEQIVSHVIGLDDHAEAFRLLGIDLEGGRRTAPSAALKVVLTP